MSAHIAVVRFVPGQRIDTRKPLEIIGLDAHSSGWEQIAAAYPEIQVAGPKASFRRRSNLIIWPPIYMPARGLRGIRALAEGHHEEFVIRRAGSFASVMVLLSKSNALHIYRIGS